MILLLNNCTQDITSSDSVPEFKVTFIDYLPASATLYIYTEIDNYSNDHSIDSVWAHVYQQNIGQVFSTELTKPYSHYDDRQTTQVYSYQGNPGFSSGNYFVKYYLREISGVNLSLTTTIKFLSAHEGDAEPEFINLEIPDIIQINNTEWKEIPIYITIFDLNGKDDIKSLIYEIKRTFYGCDGICIIDANCNEPINDTNFQPDETWDLKFIEYVDEGFKYAVILYMRPLNGSGYEDENNQFPEEDCGRTGEFEIRFILTDYSDVTIFSDEIPIAIIAQ